MRPTPKVFIVGLVSAMTFAFGAAPSMAAEPMEDFAAPAAVQHAQSLAQTLDTAISDSDLPDATTESILDFAEEAKIAHNFDVAATIALAEQEVGTSRPTGWSQPGECLMSAQRWIHAGGGNWIGGGDPVSNYSTAVRLTMAEAEPGDIIQYEFMASPTSWVTGVHTVLITGVNGDGTFQIIESNNPGGSGLVSKNTNWVPQPPAGFEAVAWRF